MNKQTPFRKNHRPHLWCSLLLAIGFVIFSSSSLAAKDPLARSIDTSIANTRQETKVQQRIDKLDEETKVMLEEYQQLSRELEVLKVYDDQLQRLVESQEAEKTSIQKQMQDLDLTQREIVPLMLRMLEWLDEFVQLDQPFLPEERSLRIEHLTGLMDRADISIGEKYRRVLESYQIEMDYSRTIEASRGELQTGDKTRTVDFLRVGRVGLYYLTLDRQEVGHWMTSSGQWQTLPSRYNLPIRNGLRMARKQAAPDLLRLPVSAPQEVRP